MDERAALLAVLCLGGAAVILWQWQQQGGDFAGFGFTLDTSGGEDTAPTAGDQESNALSDAIDSMKSTFGAWPAGAEQYRATIESAAAAYGVPADILAWLLWKESRYNPAIISGAKRSPAGAMGIAQFMPATAREELGSEAAALDPNRAIPGAARYLAKCFSWTGGSSWAKALAAYNWGAGNVNRKGMSAAPAETRDYYATIMAKANYQDATA